MQVRSLRMLIPRNGRIKAFNEIDVEVAGIDADIDLKLESIKCFYWKIGTHYYSPQKRNTKTRIDFIKSAQNSHPNG
jgi:hypothetical protein